MHYFLIYVINRFLNAKFINVIHGKQLVTQSDKQTKTGRGVRRVRYGEEKENKKEKKKVLEQEERERKKRNCYRR